MGCAIILYVVVLVLDLMVGCSLIAWKCRLKEDESECKLATGGLLGSVAVWLLVLLACPFCMVKCNYQENWENCREKLKRYVRKFRPQRHREICLQSEIYLPTTLSLRCGKGMKVPASQANTPGDEKALQRLMSPDSDSFHFLPEVVYTCNETSHPDRKGSLIDSSPPDDSALPDYTSG